MLPNKNDNNDLEYLAQQGFEKVSVSDADIADLKKRVRVKTNSFSPFYIGLSSLVIGMVLGGILFYLFYRSPQSKTKELTQNEDVNTRKQNEILGEEVIYLDTVQVIKENFIKQQTIVKIPESKEHTAPSPSVNTVEVMSSKPINPSLLITNEIHEKQLKYIINAPVFYLHNLKITNYTTLYFKKERFVKFTGVSAAYPDKNEGLGTESSLKHTSERYLHEEIAQAMLYFKNEKYDEAIQTLKIVSKYNKDDLNCNFYLAMCYYHKKNLNLAVNYFDKCLLNANNTFLQEAMYYKALSLENKGEKEQARILFKKIADAEGFYATKATAFLTK